MIEIDQELIDNQIKAAKALKSYTVVESCRTTIERECKYWGGIDPVDWFGDKNLIALVIHDSGKIIVSVILNDESGILYDKMMSNKNTVISNPEQMVCLYTIEQVLVGYDTEIHINFQIESPVTEEDHFTLMSLGKIKTETSNYSSTSRSVICEI